MTPTDVQHMVCLGLPLPAMDVRITRDRTVLGPREIGAIELRGPAVAEPLSHGGRRRFTRPP